MAKRKYNQKARALQPAVMKLHFRVAANLGQQYVDISQSVSRVNRRFYRQGLNWAVANVKLTLLPAAAPTAPTVAYVNSLPHTWVTANAWVKCFHAWKDQQDAALDDFDGRDTASTWRDFKIFADSDHADTGMGNNLSPYTLGPGTTGVVFPGLQTGANALPSEDWDFSQIVIPNQVADASGSLTLPEEYPLIMVGDGNVVAVKGMINGYQNSRNYPQSPDPVNPPLQLAANWMSAMTDESESSPEIVANATDRNNELPYDQDIYPGSGS